MKYGKSEAASEQPEMSDDADLTFLANEAQTSGTSPRKSVEVDMVLFKNSQWAVTEWGLETVRPGAPIEYLIHAHRLLEKGGIGNGEFYDWPLHLAEKTWVDMDAFNEAFVEALKHHKGKYRGDVDKKMLLASIDRVHKQARCTS